jgi:hypothetical protein
LETCPGDYYAVITSNLGITCDLKFTNVYQTEMVYNDTQGEEQTTLAVKYTSEENGCQLLVGLICDQSVSLSFPEYGTLTESDLCQYETTLTSA